MIVEYIVDLIEQYPPVRNNHDELFDLRAIIYDAVLIFCFLQIKYVCDTHVVKPDGYKPMEGRLHPDDPCP